MASILRVNTLTDASSNNSVAIETVSQGSAKAWVFGDVDASLFDSYNISSSVDNGTGNYSYNLSNSFSSANYVVVGSAEGDSDRGLQVDVTSASVYVVFLRQAGSATNLRNHSVANGDLA
jgi:hypothetical protein